MSESPSAMCWWGFYWRKFACNLPMGFLSRKPIFLYPFGMEMILKNLEEIGVAAETIEAIRNANDKEAALILLMEDDRYEYVD